jgi:hypothetical protein
MSAKELFEIPDGMRRVCRRFERWRNGHKARLPISEALWGAAAEAAREHGVLRASKALHGEYGKLKRMVEAGRRAGRRGRQWYRQRFGNGRHPRPLVSPSA